MMLATLIENTLGRLCSSSDALLPSRFACSKRCWPRSRSSIFATMRLSPTIMLIAYTAARVDAGKT